MSTAGLRLLPQSRRRSLRRMRYSPGPQSNGHQAGPLLKSEQRSLILPLGLLAFPPRCNTGQQTAERAPCQPLPGAAWEPGSQERLRGGSCAESAYWLTSEKVHFHLRHASPEGAVPDTAQGTRHLH